jgi:hypothetical protein
MIDQSVLIRALAFVERHESRRVGLCWLSPPDEAALTAIMSRQNSIVSLLDVSASGSLPQTYSGLPVFDAHQAASADIVDSVLVIDNANLALIMRRLEPLARRNLLILPCDPDWVVPAYFKEMTAERVNLPRRNTVKVPFTCKIRPLLWRELGGADVIYPCTDRPSVDVAPAGEHQA